MRPESRDEPRVSLARDRIHISSRRQLFIGHTVAFMAYHMDIFDFVAISFEGNIWFLCLYEILFVFVLKYNRIWQVLPRCLPITCLFANLSNVLSKYFCKRQYFFQESLFSREKHFYFMTLKSQVKFKKKKDVLRIISFKN